MRSRLTLRRLLGHRFASSSRFQGTLLDPNDFTCSAIDGRRFFKSDGLEGYVPSSSLVPRRAHSYKLLVLTLGTSTRGDATSMAIGYPDPGGLRGNGSARCSCDDDAGAIGDGIGFAMLGDGGTPRLLSVEGPADDCSEKDVVRVELEPVRLTLLGIVMLGEGSYSRGEYFIADCCSIHSAVRSRFWVFVSGSMAGRWVRCRQWLCAIGGGWLGTTRVPRVACRAS